MLLRGFVQQPCIGRWMDCRKVLQPVTDLRIGHALGARAFGAPRNSFLRLPMIDLKFAKLCRGITSQFNLERAKMQTSRVQGSPNFFVRGPHKLLQKSPRAGHRTQCDCFGISYILPNQQVFRKYNMFSLLTKWLCGTDEMTSRARFDPRVVVWRPWSILINIVTTR